MRHFLLLGIILSSLLCPLAYAGTAECDASANQWALQFLEGCKPNGIISDGGASGISGLQQKAVQIANRAITLGALFAIGALVWAGIQYNSSFWEDERVKHAKNTMIFAIIGLLILMISFPFVTVIVNFIYGFGR